MSIAETAPPPEDDLRGTQRLGFCGEMLQQATAAITTCEGYSKIEPALRAISGSDTVLVRPGRSETRLNEIGRTAEIMHANLTDTKPACEFRTFNTDYSQYTEDFTKLWKIWYYNNQIDQKYGATADYALACGSGYAYQYYDKRIRDMNVMALDGRDVRPLDSTDNTLASCYGVFLGRNMPLTQAQWMFPHLTAQLERDATYEPPSRLPEITQQQLARTQSRRGMSPFFAARADTAPKDQRNRMVKSVKLWWFYFCDPTMVTSREGEQVGDFEDGKPSTMWSYRAPYNTPKYPRKRLIVFSPSVLCYDGPNPYWHGMFPVSRYTMIPWPWLWPLGATPIWDCLSPQNTLTNCLRVWDNGIRRSIRPPLSADMNVNDEELKRVSEMLDAPGATWRNHIGGGIKMEQLPVIDQAVYKMIELMMQKIPQRCGVEDLSPLLQVGQIPEGDTVDRLLFATSPMVRLRSRMLETFHGEQGRMWLFNAVQHYSVRRKFQSLGSGHMKPMDFLYDPDTFLPMSQADAVRWRDQPVDVATEVLAPFAFWTSPSTLLRAAAQSERAEALALFRMGAIGPRSLLEKMDYQNIDAVLAEVAEMAKVKLQMAMAMKNGEGGGEGGGGGSGGGIPSRPLGGDPRGRKPGMGAPQLRDTGYVESQH
jgi:hypothetical protein